MSDPVFVAGAGPTGLFATLVLARMGVSVRIVDAAPASVETSRAMGVQARTLEFYRMLGMADEAIALGSKCTQVHIRRLGEEVATFSLSSMGEGVSPYPFMLTLAQDVHERFLIAKLEDLGVQVERNTHVSGVSQDAEGVDVEIVKLGQTQIARAPYVIGADGAASAVRKSLGIGFGGGTSSGLFYVADVELAEDTGTDVFMGFGPDTVNLLMPVRSTGMKRFIGFVPPELADCDDLTFADIRPRAEKMLGQTAQQVNWFSTYRVHHRVADSFRSGRCFLAGDAGHIHSPVGGQGMNTGLGDAMNLSWKLAHVVSGRADPAILDTYHVERHAFARQLIRTTDRAFQRLSTPGGVGRFLRVQFVPRLFGILTKFSVIRHALFRTISQTRIAYSQSELSAGKTGKIAGGDRLPWAASPDSHKALVLDWQLVVCGTAEPALKNAADDLGLRLHVLDWSADLARCGFEEDAAYLVRPDGYVAVAGINDSDLRAYVRRHGLRFADPERAA